MVFEKATEIGINEITPIICRYSERNKINLERSIKILDILNEAIIKI